MRQIESLFVRHRPDSPLLHCQGTEKNFYRLTVLILADAFYHQGMSRDRMAFNLGFENCGGVRFLHFTAKGSACAIVEVFRTCATDGVT